MDCSMPGFPVLHHLPKLAQTHVHSMFPSIWVFSNESTTVCATREDWFPLKLTDLISLLSKGFSRVFSSTTIGKHQFFSAQPSWWSNCHIHTWLLEKPKFWLDESLLEKQCLCFFIMLSRFVTAFLPRRKCLLISWLGSPSAVILEPKKIKFVTVSIFPIFLPWSDGTGCHDLSLLNVES